jgi:hypothetical protein
MTPEEHRETLINLAIEYNTPLFSQVLDLSEVYDLFEDLPYLYEQAVAEKLAEELQ